MIKVYSLTGSTSSFTAPAVLTGEANLNVLAQAVRVYLSNARQGTSKVKSRHEVARTTKKVYKQKGTGGARHGSRKAPIFVGGGVTFGPRGDQNWSLNLNKSQKTRALLESLRAQKENVVVLADVASAKGKTAVFAKGLKAITTDAAVLMVYDSEQATQMVGARNLATTTLRRVTDVTALDVVSAGVIAITKEAWEPLVKRLGADTQGRLKKEEEAAPAKKSTKVTTPVVKKAAAKKAAPKATKETK